MNPQLKFIIRHRFRDMKISQLYLNVKKHIKLAKQKYYLFPLFLKGKLPIRYLLIELSSVCNLNCKWCIIERKKRGFIDLVLFENILQQIAEKEIVCKEISLNGGGEMLLHPQFKKILELISKFKKENKNFPLVVLITNATLLNKKKSQNIFDSDAIDVIRFSVDGGSKKEFEKIRIGAKWEKVIKNINFFIDLKRQKRKSLYISIISIIDPLQILSPEFKELIKCVDEYLPRKPHNWTGEKEFKDFPKKPNNLNQNFCEDIFRSILIHWNGLVSPCCVDLNSSGIIGDLNKNNLKDIAYGKKKTEMVKNMYLNCRSMNKLCQNCNL